MMDRIQVSFWCLFGIPIPTKYGEHTRKLQRSYNEPLFVSVALAFFYFSFIIDVSAGSEKGKIEIQKHPRLPLKKTFPLKQNIYTVVIT